MDNINSRKVTSISRRKFIVSSAAAGGGLALGINLPFSILPAAAQNAAADPEVTAWVVVRPDDTCMIRVARTEMGQGTLTGLAHRRLVGACAEAADMVDQILHEKALGEIAQRRAGVGVFHSEFLEFSEKCRRVVSRSRLRTRLADIAGNGIETEVAITVHDARTKSDG